MKNQQPTYSLIIPHFNDPIRLERLLRSVPVERADVEVIVVDDCSPDQNILGVVQARWPSVRWLSTPVNTGAGAARNVGLDAATGRWLVFADSDDLFEPSAFDAFDGSLDDNIDIIFFQTRSVNEESLIESARDSETHEVTRRAFHIGSHQVMQKLKEMHGVPWGKLFRRRFVVENRFRFEEVRYSNDVMFSLRCNMAAAEVKVIGVVGYSVTRRRGSLTQTRSRESFLVRYEVFLGSYQFLRTHGAGSRGRSLLPICARALRFGPGTVLEVWRRGREAKVPLLAAKFARPAWWLQKAKVMALGIKEQL